MSEEDIYDPCNVLGEIIGRYLRGVKSTIEDIEHKINDPSIAKNPTLRANLDQVENTAHILLEGSSQLQENNCFSDEDIAKMQQLRSLSGQLLETARSMVIRATERDELFAISHSAQNFCKEFNNQLSGKQSSFQRIGKEFIKQGKKIQALFEEMYPVEKQIQLQNMKEQRWDKLVERAKQIRAKKKEEQTQ